MISGFKFEEWDAFNSPFFNYFLTPRITTNNQCTTCFWVFFLWDEVSILIPRPYSNFRSELFLFLFIFISTRKKFPEVWIGGHNIYIFVHNFWRWRYVVRAKINSDTICHNNTPSTLTFWNKHRQRIVRSTFLTLRHYWNL